MKTRDIIDLILLASIWGASFLFMRVSVPEFGAVPMMAVRVLIAGLVLLPIVIWKKRQAVIRKNIIPLSIIGIFSSAIPFSLIAYSTLYVTAGFASLLNAATPIFAATIAFIWLGQKLTKTAVLGLVIGVFGVILLVWDKLGLSSTEQNDTALAILAGIAGTFFYGLSANMSKKYLSGVGPMTITSVTQLAAAVVLLPLAYFWWPENPPSRGAWINVILLAVVCTAFAQILFFRLIERTSATIATSVTFLIPIFGLLWGNLFLNEVIETNTVIAGFVILLGVSMIMGILKFSKKSDLTGSNNSSN